MKINDLTKQISDLVGIEVINKDVMDYLKGQGFEIKSHMQNATDEMIESATKHFEEKFKKAEKLDTKEEKDKEEDKKVVTPTVVKEVSKKKFEMDDLIPCRSVTPWKLNAIGVDRVTVYHWNYFGDVDYVRYKDLQSMRRKDIITKPKIIIEDADLCLQWSRELGEIYKPFLGVEYPEELFELSDKEFEDMLKNSNDTVKEVVKVTARNMVNNKNYPTVQKLTIVDEILGTCIKEFL